MLIDSLALLAAGIFALLGFVSGWWRQVVKLGALVAAYFLSAPVGKILAPWLATRLELPALVARLGGAVLAFLLIYLVLSAVGYLVVRRWKKKAAQEGRYGARLADGMAGAVLGAAKVLGLVYVALCFVVLVMGQTAGKDALSTILGESRLAGFARRHNVLSGLHLPLAGKLPQMVRVLKDPQAMERAADSPQLRRLAEHPKVKALAGDERLRSAIESNDLATVLANPRLNALAADPEIMKLLENVDWEKAAAGK